MKVCVTRRIPGPAVELLKAKGYEVSVSLRDHPLNREELLDFVKGAEAILCLLTDTIDAAVFEAAGPNLKIVANYAIGFENVDLAAAKSRKVWVTNAPAQAICRAVAEHTLALILALTKRLKEADDFVREGSYKGWDPNLLIGTELSGKRLGIVGLGRIGCLVAQAAQGLKMKVLYTGPNKKETWEKELGAEFRSLNGLLEESDVVSLHLPLLLETRHLINEQNLKFLKKTAYLVNTARGGVVEEKALVAALKEGRLAGAALDVFEFEPSVNQELCEMANVILTPHIASATKEAREEMSRLAAENVIAVLEGKPPLNPAFISD